MASPRLSVIVPVLVKTRSSPFCPAPLIVEPVPATLVVPVPTIEPPVHVRLSFNVRLKLPASVPLLSVNF